jgi:pimeloyl-ACP methyl ester carboxylesterase
MRLTIGLMVLVLSGCATLSPKKDDGADLSITQTSEIEFVTVSAQAVQGLADYKFAGADHKAEYIDCKVANAKATIILSHTDRAGFDTAKFCPGWIAQSFLSQGFDVIAVNRPGYGKSTGNPDFSGAQSLVAMEAGVNAAMAAAKNPHKPGGIWGYSTGVTGAALLARKLGNLKFMMLGAGVYDYDLTLSSTQDSYLKKDLEKIKETGGNKAIEDRSIAYDVSGFPKNVIIYHGRQDTAVSPDQAKSFSDSLESSEYHVTFQVLDGVTHNIPWVHHRKILEVLARSQL